MISTYYRSDYCNNVKTAAYSQWERTWGALHVHNDRSEVRALKHWKDRFVDM